MNKWYEWFFSGAGVAVVTALVTALITLYRARAKWFTGIRFLDRDQVDREVGSLQRRLEKAKSSVWISGNDCKIVVEGSNRLIDGLLQRGIPVKLLMIDPGSAAPEMLCKIDPRFRTADEFRSSMAEVLRLCRDWKLKYPSQFEFRLLPILPALGFFISDPASPEGVVKIEIYTAKNWRPLDTRPHVVVSRRAQQWRDYFIQQWENYWALGK